MDPLVIRPWTEADPIPPITSLLHAAYAEWAEQGLNFVACHQDDTRTRKRLLTGHSLVAVEDGEIIGTITLQGPNPESACTWFTRPEVWTFGQFAVRPDRQQRGIGSRLLEAISSLANANGAGELALDTSEQATRLIDSYTKRGFRFVQFQKWDEVNYRSVVLSKSLSVR